MLLRLRLSSPLSGVSMSARATWLPWRRRVTLSPRFVYVRVNDPNKIFIFCLLCLVDLLTSPQFRKTWGLQRTNRELSEGLSLSLSCRLRWGGRSTDNATLAVILMRRKEYHRLQAFLTAFFKKPDSEMIKDIFEVRLATTLCEFSCFC